MSKVSCICLFGFGTVGKGVMAVMYKNSYIVRNRLELDLRIAVILTRRTSKTTMINANSMQKNPIYEPRMYVLVEAVGGTCFARYIMLSTLNTKKLLVTANKTLIACYNFELRRTYNNILLEASVAGGIPILRILEKALVGNMISYVAGVLNGTSNWSLSQMYRLGVPLKRALLDASQRGYAETDNTCDIDGVDSTQKTSIIYYITLRTAVTIRYVFFEGIRTVSLQDIAYGKRLGLNIKLMSVVLTIRKALCATFPCFVSLNWPFWIAEATSNVILVVGDCVGRMWLFGKGAGTKPTASSIIADVETIRYGSSSYPTKILTHTYSSITDSRGGFYVRSIHISFQECKESLNILLKRKLNLISFRVFEVNKRLEVIMVLINVFERSFKRAVVSFRGFITTYRVLL
ncbi:homoserine dehydrogenase [Candidatus Tremblaya phenacola]|uniref:homoserine dehydrogenase n=1 Tax=Candidatus Tremblayella phenacoccinincola TaxID=1010676 RepID=A0A2G0V714_9PROT|nr:homoserine dehydrogenase [Candidatus Tremblaya phenacola]PHN16253.1 Homoserine dehydrogenase [Candidatus Tremblaya phenacola]